MDFNEFFRPLTDAFSEASTQIKLAMECKMRRFYIKTMTVYAQGVLFEDGCAVVREGDVTMIYPGLDDLVNTYGAESIAYVDAEKVA